MEIYKDISYTPQERAEDLLKRMTPEEKLAQLQCSLVIDTENLMTKLTINLFPSPRTFGNVSSIISHRCIIN